MHYRLSIDVGTSNTAAAVAPLGGAPVPLRLTSQADTMPSCVLLYGNELRVGDEALRLAALDMSAFERTPKRRLGGPVLLGGRLVDPVDLVAAVLAQVLKVAVHWGNGALPTQVVLTHPQAWGDFLIGRLREAATRAGLPATATLLIPEPIAALHAFGAVSAWRPGDNLAVVDFGGGTFDSAVCRVASGRTLDVTSATGIDPLGGDDFDTLLEDWVLGQLRSSGRDVLATALQNQQSGRDMLTFRDEVRRAKEGLSTHASTVLRVIAAGSHADVTVTQAEFEQLIRSRVQAAAQATRAQLAGGGKNPVALRQLFLTGGSSLIPLVQREFQKVTGGHVGHLGDPKTVTAVGALRVPVTRPPAGSRPTPWLRRIVIGSTVAVGGLALIASAMSGPGGSTPTGRGSSSSPPHSASTAPGSQIAQGPTPGQPACTVDTAHCNLASYGAPWSNPATCVYASPSDSRLSAAVACTPSQKAVSITGAATFYMAGFGTIDDLDSWLASQVGGRTLSSDASLADSRSTWTLRGAQRGDLYNLAQSGNVEVLYWTDPGYLSVGILRVEGGDAGNVLAWFNSDRGRQ